MGLVRARERRPRCPLCRVDLEGGALVPDECAGCGTRYHADCLTELGGCSTLGCPRVGVPPGAPTPAEQRFRDRLRRRVDASREHRPDRRRLHADHRARLVEQAGRPAPPGELGWFASLGLEVLFNCLAECCLGLLFAGVLLVASLYGVAR